LEENADLISKIINVIIVVIIHHRIHAQFTVISLLIQGNVLAADPTMLKQLRIVGNSAINMDLIMLQPILKHSARTVANTRPLIIVQATVFYSIIHALETKQS